jgi:arsenate reductase-like glutaredoxin family protein
MTIKIFGRKSSCNVQKVIWFCSEANISFETVDYVENMVKLKKIFLNQKTLIVLFQL